MADPQDELLEAIMGTAEIMGRQMTATGGKMLLRDLAGFPAPVVIKALSRCRMELRTFPTTADILARIDDGRPGAEEAWAMIPQDESTSVVWSDEMAEAYGVCRGLLDDDPIAARMAFKESYTRIVSDARAAKRAPKWTPSLGHDPRGREVAIEVAVAKGRLSAAHALDLLPDNSRINPKISALLGLDAPK